MRSCSQPIYIAIRPSISRKSGDPLPGIYDSRLMPEGRVLCTSRQPLLDAARVLIAEGHHPSAPIVMRHDGSGVDSFRTTLGKAASLTVEEDAVRGPRLKRWKAFCSGAVAARIAANDNSATPVQGAITKTNPRKAA
jgi:hypothetical protein